MPAAEPTFHKSGLIQNDSNHRYLLIARTPSTNRRRSAASIRCAASHSSLSIASSVPCNSAFAAKNEADAALLPRPAPSFSLLDHSSITTRHYHLLPTPDYFPSQPVYKRHHLPPQGSRCKSPDPNPLGPKLRSHRQCNHAQPT